MKKLLIIIFVCSIILFGGIIVKIVFFPLNTVAKSIDMSYDIVGQTLDGKNAIYNYEWFKQQEADIRKCLENENIAQKEYDMYFNTLSNNSSEWTKFQEQEESSLRNSLFALQKITNKAIEDYNAKASMVNRSIFKDNLPSNISRALYTGLELIK